MVALEPVAASMRSVAQKTATRGAMAHGAIPSGAVGTGARAVSVSVAERHTKNEVKLSGEERAIGALSKVREFGFAAWMPGWMMVGPIPLPLPVVTIFGGLAGLLAKGAAMMRWEGGRSALSSLQSSAEMALKGVTGVIEKVSLNQLHQAPGTLLKEMGAEAGRRNNWMGKVAPTYLNKWGNAVNGVMNDAVAKRVAPVGDAIVKAAERVGSFGGNVVSGTMNQTMANGTASVGIATAEKIGAAGGTSSINSILGRVFDYRHGRVLAKAESLVESANAAFTQAPRTFWQRLTRQTPTALPAMPTELATAFSHVKTGGVSALQKASAELEALAKNGAPEIAKHAASVAQQVNKALASASKAVHLENVAKGGVGEWLKATANKMGNVKLKTAIITTAVVAGSAIAFLGARVQGKKDATALADFKADAGADSALTKSAQQSAANGTLGRYAGAVVSSAGESMMLAHNPALMAPQIALMMAGGQLGGSSQLLAAHQALKNAESGIAPLEPRAKFECVKELVAVVPAVAANGGKYNRLASPVAAAIVEKNMSVKDTMHLLNDAAAFNTFATDVKAKMDAAAAPKTTVAAKTATLQAEKPVATVSPADKPLAPSHNAAAPMITSGAQHQGVVHAQQRAVAS